MVTNYTSRAWTDSHIDFFTRNIYTVNDDGGGDLAAARARNEFLSNAVGLPWPTEDEVMQWREHNGQGEEVTAPQALVWATAAAVSRIAERCGLLVLPVDADGVVDPAGDPVKVPPEIFLAACMQAARWYERRITASGVLGSDSLGGTVRVGRFDADVEALIANHVEFGLA